MEPRSYYNHGGGGVLGGTASGTLSRPDQLGAPNTTTHPKVPSRVLAFSNFWSMASPKSASLRLQEASSSRFSSLMSCSGQPRPRVVMVSTKVKHPVLLVSQPGVLVACGASACVQARILACGFGSGRPAQT